MNTPETLKRLNILYSTTRYLGDLQKSYETSKVILGYMLQMPDVDIAYSYIGSFEKINEMMIVMEFNAGKENFTLLAPAFFFEEEFLLKVLGYDNIKGIKALFSLEKSIWEEIKTLFRITSDGIDGLYGTDCLVRPEGFLTKKALQASYDGTAWEIV